MNIQNKLLMGACALIMASHIPAMAGTTESVTSKTSTVNPDGSVSYESHTVVTKDSALPEGVTKIVGFEPVMPGVVTFYYYNPTIKRIVSAGDLTNDIISLWDHNNNKVIDNQEFYSNAMVAYEPVEYSKRTYTDIDADGIPELTQEEYTTRLQQVPYYSKLNMDKKAGLTLYEFTGVGFQDADNDNDNQVSYDELKAAFYHKEGLAPKPEKTNH